MHSSVQLPRQDVFVGAAGSSQMRVVVTGNRGVKPGLQKKITAQRLALLDWMLPFCCMVICYLQLHQKSNGMVSGKWMDTSTVTAVLFQ